MHTLFVRKHNRLCLEILAHHPDYAGDDERIYQLARKIVGGQMQSINYNEFLPALLGPNALKPFNSYDQQVNAAISNEFSTACYRLGHSMLSATINVGSNGRTLRLRDAFFDPRLVEYNGIESFLSGLATQIMQKIDGQIVEDVSSFLFGPPDSGRQRLLDLGALNIQRGRDYGLPDYNRMRIELGLPAVTCFADITRSTNVQEKLEKAYGDVDSIDPWLGGLVEDHVDDANVGILIFTVLKDQFERLRDGHRSWFEIDAALTAERKDEIRQTRLSDIIRRNTDITDIPDDVFRLEEAAIPLQKASYPPLHQKLDEGHLDAAEQVSFSKF